MKLAYTNFRNKGVLSSFYHNSEIGLLFKALVGYNGNPSLTEVTAYLAYLGSIVTYVLTRKQRMVTARVSVAG